MNEKEKQEYLEKYHEEKEKGVPFFPDIIFKDAVISFLIFLVLIGLAYFIGAPLEARANPNDTSYTPRPEWYFLFLFQLLKYFPGKLEVVGVVLIPTLAILVLFLLPVLDRNTKRYFLSRPIVSGITLLAVAGVVTLTILAVREAPPPTQATQGDPVALLYSQNCAPCHGTSITVPPGTNLHSLIAQGSHVGMPAWSGDLSSDQIDELAGFVLSPGGSQLFNTNCSACHKVEDLVGGNPLNLKNSIDEGLNFTPHANLQAADWSTSLTKDEKTTLLNFLIAPDGQRLFTIYCSPCHGQSVAYSGNEAQLRQTIIQGGQHLTMPPWQNTLTTSQIDTLANYVVDPVSAPDGQALFKQYCSNCHGERIPPATNVDQASQTIATGGAHLTMPVWGTVLTQAQIDALVNFIVSSSQGTSIQRGQTLFAQNCAVCHGELGEGGPNPANPNQLIAAIGTAEFLNTRDDTTLFQIISQGQPDQGMSPFGSANGGNLDDDQINSIVAYLRSWQANPPVTTPPQITIPTINLSAADVYQTICAQCHGQNGEGLIGPPLNDLSDDTDQDIYDVISQGTANTNMLSFGSILSDSQIQGLVAIIRQFPPAETSPQPTPTTQPTPGVVTFDANILPIFQQDCVMCHGTLGGWDSTSYQAIMTTGDHTPVVIPGDATNSILTQKLQGTASFGGIMPPSGKLPAATIQIILDWIAAGASEK
ncbi:MAG: c-type cytochrome [Anaerolineales bacterium]